MENINIPSKKKRTTQLIATQIAETYRSLNNQPIYPHDYWLQAIHEDVLTINWHLEQNKEYALVS